MSRDLKKKWITYEKRWRFRDFYFNKCLRRHGIVKYFHRASNAALCTPMGNVKEKNE